MVLSMPFMQNALLAGLLASVACGIIGTLVAANRMLFLAGGVAHTAYGGVGLALFLGLPVLPTTLVFSIGAALLMSALSLKSRINNEILIGALWAVGMAAGIMLIDLTPGYRADLGTYLFGNILAVSGSDILLMLALDGLVLLLVVGGFQGLLAFTFDRDFAASRGLPVAFLHHLLVALAAVCVVMLIRVVGLLLVMALFTLPPAIAARHARTFQGTMLLAVLGSGLFCSAGLVLAAMFDLASGAMIILVACAVFALSLLWTKLKKLREKRHERTA
ncbi:MAG: metal ABC transporter permease [Desulfovibrionaceae bacterium]|nr:metal ABC transporter permease [Desulfovibrionaceae bacterium]